VDVGGMGLPALVIRSAASIEQGGESVARHPLGWRADGVATGYQRFF
jgi:hypothetical protein